MHYRYARASGTLFYVERTALASIASSQVVYKTTKILEADQTRSLRMFQTLKSVRSGSAESRYPIYWLTANCSSFELQNQILYCNKLIS